jgi:hypothetical protein
MRGLVAGAVALALTAGPAHAEWRHFMEKDPFTDAEMHSANVSTSGFSFGMQCQAQNPYALYFVTNEDLGIRGAALRELEPAMVLRVDDGPVERLPAAVIDIEGRYAVITVALGALKIAQGIRDAADRVAVAIDYNDGRREFVRTFDVDEARTAISKAIAGCTGLLKE